MIETIVGILILYAAIGWVYGFILALKDFTDGEILVGAIWWLPIWLDIICVSVYSFCRDYIVGVKSLLRNKKK